MKKVKYFVVVIVIKNFDTLKGVTCHENLYCKQKKNKLIKDNQQNIVDCKIKYTQPKYPGNIGNEKCDCITSFLNPHRRKKCLINNIFDKLNSEEQNIVQKSDNKYTNCKKDSDIKIFYCSYCNKEFDTHKGVQCHENLYCKQKKKIINKEPVNKCYRCGREGHYSNDCYASKHVNGKCLN